MAKEPGTLLNSTDKPLAGSAVSPLKADDRWFRAVADFTYDWESWHGPDGRLLWVNPAVERITGYSVEACLAMPDYPLPLVAAEDRPRIANVLASAVQRNPGDDVEFRVVRPDGQTRWMGVSWQPMYSDEGQYLGFRTSVRDVTERRRLRDQLRLHADHLEQLVQERTARLRRLERRQRQMEKLAALGQLAAGVAHEVNNPLAGIRNAFELIKSSLTPTHPHYELIELIDREIDRISGIVHQMFQLYRRDPQQPSDFALTQAIGDVVHLLEHAAKKRGVALRWDPPADAAWVHLPEGEVKQVLYNLVRNAIQASPDGGEVTIQLEPSGGELRVHVQDQGPGITDDVLPRIFDPFFSTKHEEAQGGMGLGLSVSRSLIEAMGGRIDVETTAGQGARFTAVFPQQVEGQERRHG